MGSHWSLNEISTWYYSHRKTVHIYSNSDQLTASILLLFCHNTRPSSSTPLVFVPLEFADLKFILLKRAHLTMHLISPSPWFLAFYHFCAIGKFYLILFQITMKYQIDWAESAAVGLPGYVPLFLCILLFWEQMSHRTSYFHKPWEKLEKLDKTYYHKMKLTGVNYVTIS